MSLEMLWSWDRVLVPQIPLVRGVCRVNGPVGDTFLSPSLLVLNQSLMWEDVLLVPVKALVPEPVVALGLQGHPSPGCSPVRCDTYLKPDLRSHPSVRAAGPGAARATKPQWANIPGVQRLWGWSPCPQPSCWCGPSPAGPTAG